MRWREREMRGRERKMVSIGRERDGKYGERKRVSMGSFRHLPTSLSLRSVLKRTTQSNNQESNREIEIKSMSDIGGMTGRKSDIERIRKRHICM